MKKKKERKWYPLDNAAKIFPPTRSRRDPKVFRFSCILFEDIKPKFLEEALLENLKLFPIYRSTLKKGFFWYYLETTDIIPKVVPEHDYPCSKIYEKGKETLLFNVTFYKKRINLEVFHVLSDGLGALNFFKSLVTLYLKNIYKNSLPSKENLIELNSSTNERMDDSFKKYYKKYTTKNKNFKKYKTYILKGDKIEVGKTKVIIGHLNIKDILKLTHEYNTSLTTFITSIYILALIETLNNKDKKNNITIAIPVNLRKYFNSPTVRNFFNLIYIDYFYKENDNLKTIIKDVTEKLNENLKDENIKQHMYKLASIEHNYFIKLIPLFLKDIILALTNKFLLKKSTITISNLGQIKVNQKLENKISHFDVFMSNKRQQICLCSYNNTLSICFTSQLVSNDIEKNFFKLLSNLNLDITIESNKNQDMEE